MDIALLFVGGLLIIVVGAELFANAVEWLGYRLRLGTGATGSLLAAIGTSLPEFFVPVVALITNAGNADRVAMGSVLGAPFLLLTAGAGITGIAVLLRPDKQLHLEAGQVRRDLGAFVTGFALVLLAIAVRPPYRYVISVCLLGMYASYVWRTLKSGEPREEMPEPLHLLRFSKRDESYTFIVTQLVVAIGLLAAGSDLFVHSINAVASAWKLDALLVAVVLVPLATELPETFNSVLWVRKNDDGLAFGNVAGSATFQACILGFIGVTFTSWAPGNTGLASAGVTMATAIFLTALLFGGRAHGGWLTLAILPWVGFVAGELVLHL